MCSHASRTASRFQALGGAAFISLCVMALASTSVAQTEDKPGAAVPVGTVQGTVKTVGSADGPVIVYLKDLPGTVVPPKERQRVRQKNTQFMPRVLIVVKGEIVDFPNEDLFYHNVFSVDEGNTFDLGLYRGGVSKSARMKEAGEMKVYCNIHEDMAATVLVVDNPHYVAIDSDGSFKLEGVPAGKRTLVAWSASHEPKELEVVVSPTAAASADVTLARRPEKRHMNKHGEDYGRYR